MLPCTLSILLLFWDVIMLYEQRKRNRRASERTTGEHPGAIVHNQLPSAKRFQLNGWALGLDVEGVANHHKRWLLYRDGRRSFGTDQLTRNIVM